MSDLSILIIVIVSVVLLCFGTFHVLIRNIFNPVGWLSGFLFLICLKTLMDLNPSSLIEPAILFQIDATIIAGAIVLLTITSFVGKRDHEPIGVKIWKNHGLAFTPHQVAAGAIVAFGISSIYLMFSKPNSQEEFLAYVLAATGFVWLIISGFVISGKEQFDAFKKSNNKNEPKLDTKKNEDREP